MMRSNRKFFSIFFFLLFIAVKGLSFHPTAHENDADLLQCNLCEHVILSEIHPAVCEDIIEISQQTTQVAQIQPEFYALLSQQSDLVVHTCRPPPAGV